jgi:hypothetical protein
MMAGRIRKLFSNEEIRDAVEQTENIRDAALLLEQLRGVAVGPQLVRYWLKHLDMKKRNGQPYIGTTVLDRGIQADMQLRVPTADDFVRKDLAEAVHDNSCILNIPDQHAPYQHPDTLAFLCDVAGKIRPTRVINMGDETDGHALSMHDSDPSLDSAGPELYKARMFIRDLASIFPVMDVCHSNHGSLI